MRKRESYNYSVGVQRELGWGTVVDVTYAGYQMRNGEMETNINPLPEARAFSTSIRKRRPAQSDSGQTGGVPRPYVGYQAINIRSHFGTARYNSLQVRSIAATSGAAVRGAYTLAKSAATGPPTTPCGPGSVERGARRLHPVP